MGSLILVFLKERNMEKSAFSPSKEGSSKDKNEEESDSNWSDINSSDEGGDEGEKSLQIDIPGQDEEETDISTANTPQQQKGSTKSPARKHPLLPFTAMSGSSKKSKMKHKRNVKAKRRLGLKKIGVPDEIANGSANQKLDKIEQFANQRKMNRTQVKTVIRGILETPDLLNYIRQQAGEIPPDSVAESTSQPEVRVTRTVAKNVTGKPWILEQFNSEKSPVTPIKKNKKRKNAEVEVQLWASLLAQTLHMCTFRT